MDNFATQWAQAAMNVAGLLALLILWLGIRIDRRWMARKWYLELEERSRTYRKPRHMETRYTRPTPRLQIDDRARKMLLESMRR